jgi:glucokinase
MSAGRHVLGVDIGGTNIVVGLVPEEGGVPVALRARATRSMSGPEDAVRHIARLAREVVADVESESGGGVEVVGAGVGCPGPVDRKAGRVVDAFNLGWDDFPLRDRLAEVLGLPVYLDNDANCAAYGEWWQGAGRPFRSLVGVTLGTGIGGGLVMDGRVVRGASGTAGELGHMTIAFQGRRCACGSYGCLEAYASGPNIAARAREAMEAGTPSILMDLVEGDLDRITALTVYEALVQGDEHAREVMLETAKILGAGIANVVNLLNPEAVVIVGGVTRAGDHLFHPLRAEVRRRAFRRAEEVCHILPGALPDRAGVTGAAGLFLQSRGDG